MACRVSLMRDGVLERTASRTWQRDITLGANTLTIATGEDSPQLCEITLHGAQMGNSLSELAVPPRFVYVPTGIPKVSPYNIGRRYREFAHAIRTGQSGHPTFDTPVKTQEPKYRSRIDFDLLKYKDIPAYARSYRPEPRKQVFECTPF